VWQRVIPGINEAHNGYLEVYLNLGLIGVFLLIALLLSSYRTICKITPTSSLASLGLALWTIVLFYNMTESAAFRGNLMWITFLLVTIVVSPRAPIDRGAPPASGPLFKESASKLREGVAA